MTPDVVVFLVPITLFLSIAWVIKVLSDNKTRRRLAERGVSERMVEVLFARREDINVPAALKWGLVTVGIGLALTVVQVLPYEFDEPIAYGLMFIFAGAGLLIYYAMASREEGSARERESGRAGEESPPVSSH